MQLKKYPHNPPHLFVDGAFLDRKDGTPGRKVWWNYWDTCIRGDIDFEFRTSYIYWNALKHGVVEHPKDYKWSSLLKIYTAEILMKSHQTI